MNAIKNLDEKGLPATPDEGFAAGLAAGYVVTTYKMIEDLLSKMPEPGPEEYIGLMSVMEQSPYLQRDWIIEFGKRMPHRPGGAPLKLDAQKKTRVCKLVGDLMGAGDTYAEAVAKAANRFQVSTKTIQRAWQEARRTRKRGL